MSRCSRPGSGPARSTARRVTPGCPWWSGHGAGAAQALLQAGLLDDMEIHLVQVLLGGGRRLFDSLGPGHIELELVRRLEGRDVTHLRYRVRQSATR